MAARRVDAVLLLVVTVPVRRLVPLMFIAFRVVGLFTADTITLTVTLVVDEVARRLVTVRRWTCTTRCRFCIVRCWVWSVRCTFCTVRRWCCSSRRWSW